MERKKSKIVLNSRMYAENLLSPLAVSVQNKFKVPDTAMLICQGNKLRINNLRD